MTIATMILIAVAFVWLGMVLGISFLEAPLKFRAPGITIPLGVGIGRLVFRTLNLIEGVLAITLVIAALVQHPTNATVPYLIGAVVVVLAIGALVLRPLMDRRVRAGTIADGQPKHFLHIGYVVLEVVKVGLLVTIGFAVLGG